MSRTVAISSARILAFVLALLLSVAVHAQALTAGKPQFFRPHASAVAKAARSANAPGVVSQAVPVAFNAAEMLGLRHLDEVQLTLPNARTHTLVFELARDHGGGIASWVGYFKERGNSNRVILTTGPTGSYGVIDTPDGSYRVVPGEGHDWLVDMTQEQLHLPILFLGDDSLIPPLMPELAPLQVNQPSFDIAIPGVNSVSAGTATPVPQNVVDLMVVVTRTLANALGSNLMTRLNFLMTRANTTYTDSEIAITLRLVNLAVVDYPDNTSDGTALNAITPSGGGGTGVFADIEAMRTASGADLVSFMRNGSSFGGSGIAWVGSTSPNPPFMYSVVTGCVAGCESVFIHEVGHNMGNKHDRNTNAFQNGGTSGGAYAWSFGYAYCETGALTCTPNIASGTPGTCTTSQPECSLTSNNNFRDIMAYFQGSTQQIYKFSNPNITCATANGDGILRPCGISEGFSLSTSANTARSMNDNRIALSAVKSQVAAANMPGSLQFTQTGYSGAETGGTITFTVSRVGGSGGAISANYSVAGATATAGVDFAAGGGALSWADGDSASKTFSLTLTNDQAVEGIEAFTATLSSPTGAPAVFLGYPNAAVGLILETWPPGGVLPAGFTTPNGSAGAWTVASDQAFEGTSSLRSAQVYGNFSTYTNSDLTFTGTLLAAPVAFAYRVSSYEGYGVLEFIVDGTTVLSDTGETGWKTFFYNLAAQGPHTLTWRFKNRLPSACNGGWNPPPQGGAACADRAWIDAVSLPVVLTASSTAIVSNANPANLGQSVTFTANITAAGTPTGTVAFYDGSTAIAGCTAVNVVSASAACTTSAFPLGTRSITAAYSGSTTHAASLSSALSQTILGGQALTVTKSGAGTVTSVAAGISCGATCTANFNTGTSVTLTAAAGSGSVFAGWSGACSGTGTCIVTMNAATSVSATFTTAAGPPTAMANPASIDFGGQSTGTTSLAQTVTITNIGADTLSVSGVSVNNTQFAQTNNCGSVGAGGTCTINVTFSPATIAGAVNATAPVSGTLTITSNGTGSPNTVALSGTAEKSLVTHYYRSILRRAPDAGGKSFWESEAARLVSLAANVSEAWYAVAMSFYFSPEYTAFNRDDTGFVTDLYNTFFNRPPDGGGLSYWTGQIAAGMPREAVLAGFMFSTEFGNFTQGIFGNTAARAEVDTVVDFYRGLLSRLPDTAGYNFWVQQFRTAQCQGAGAVYSQVESISNGFASGTEYILRGRTNAQYVGDLYNAFLRRGGDLAGVLYWISELNNNNRTRNAVRQAFLTAPEFAGRVSAIIAQGCMP